jgi:hypothetical protein
VPPTHVGEMGESVVADVDVNVAEQLRIAADEDRAAIGVQRAAADPLVRVLVPGAAGDVGVVEINGRTAANRCDRAGVEKAAVDVAGHVLENDRAAIQGFDLATVLVGHACHGVENDLAAVLGEEASAVIGDADVWPFQPDRAAATGRVELALVGDGKRVVGEPFEEDAAVMAGFDQGAVAVVKLPP